MMIGGLAIIMGILGFSRPITCSWMSRCMDVGW
jgi:hypothetical protein